MSVDDLEKLRLAIANALCDAVEPLFTKDMRLTLVARHVDNPDCHITVSNDDVDKVIALLQRGPGEIIGPAGSESIGL